ncbi:MAG: membrane protein insertase YidC [Vicinamibacterales bacterium]
MERRVLVAIVLSFLVLYTYQAFFVKPAPRPAATKGASGASTAAKGGTPSPAPVQPATPEPPAESPGDVVVGDTVERDIQVETADVIATFTNRGARLKSWTLRHYLNERKEPLELIANDLPDVTLPLTVTLDDPALSRTVGEALYSVSGAPAEGTIGAQTALRFEFRNSAGVHAVKVVTLEPAGYMFGLRSSVELDGRTLPASISWGPALGDHDSGTGRYAVKARGLQAIAQKVQRVAGSDVAEQATHKGAFQFVGVDDHYFMTIAVDPGPATVTYDHVSIPPPAGSKDPARELMAYSIRTDQPQDLRFFVGPKDYELLQAIDNRSTTGTRLVRAIDFGMFDVVVVPLLRALNWLNRYIGNYGWAIIVLTILINAVMFPLRHKSVVSMRRMQEIQPEAKAIQERYAKYKSSDPEKQKMNQELMALYRERGVNPASGCVPMLLTFPVLFAFYALLSTAIELRGAPFVGWIHDLSMPDPYYVTPVLMGLSQIWQTRITPQAGADPAQQKMMMFMPVLFMFFFLWAPAGVAIYWFVSNIWGIGQTYLTNYLIGPPNIRTVRPAAERRVKRVGSSKTEAAAREN